LVDDEMEEEEEGSQIENDLDLEYSISGQHTVYGSSSGTNLVVD
jgi:hypothetical protein